MKLYLLIIFLFTSFTEAQIDTSIIEGSRRFLYSNDAHHYPFYLDTISWQLKKLPLKEGLNFYVFNHVIDSPLKNTKFLLFHSTRMDPRPHYLIASYKDTFNLVYDSWCKDSYGCNSLVEFINQRLLDEETLQTHQLYELAITLGRLSSSRYRIVSTDNEVCYTKNFDTAIVHIPDSLKGLVKPLLIETTGDSTVLEFFVWSIYRLEKVMLWYRKKQIEVNSKLIWKSGYQPFGG